MSPRLSALLIAVILPAVPIGLGAQSAPSAGSSHACDLATNADVGRVTGRQLKRPPERLSTVQQTESACDFYEAGVQVALLTTLMPREKLHRALDGNGFERAGQAVTGVGDSAAVYYRPKGAEPEAFLVTYVGTRTVTVRVTMPPGETSESARPYAVALATLAAAKLR